MIEIESFVNTTDDHDCDYRTVYRTHKLLVTKVLEKLQQLTNEKVSIEHVNARDFTEAINDIREVANQVSLSKQYIPTTGTLYKKIGDRNGANHREEGY